MRPRHAGTALTIAGLATILAGCASSGAAVPRPFPGAPAPPPARQPPVATAPVVPTTPAPAPTAGARPTVEAPSEAPPQPVPVPGLRTEVPIPDTIRAELVATALGLRGLPYRNGGSDPSGFDCSGFVQYVFKQHDMALPRETREQYAVGDAIRLDAVQPGDLVFFQTVSRGPSHVGVAIGGDQFIHAPNSRGVVRIERYTGVYWSTRYIGARRIVTPTSAE